MYTKNIIFECIFLFMASVERKVISWDARLLPTGYFLEGMATYWRFSRLKRFSILEFNNIFLRNVIAVG